MDEAKEELEAALLQAKQHCVDIQQKVWDHEKQGLHPHEDLYVRRYIYGVTIARKSRFFNGYRPSDVPRSKSLTRIFMEQRYHRSKSTPPQLQKRERSEPKVKIWDSSDGLSTKVEFTETVDESSVRDMIENDKEECDELGRKLPVDKRNWEHVEDIRMQVSDGIAQKGALLRIGEHLYGFDGIRDLSFQAAADVDRFFGRDPSPDLMFASPYHLLKDYLEEYENRFFKNSLSRSAHDLSEWRKRSSETPAAVVGSSISVGDHLEQAPDGQSQTGYNAYQTETSVQNESHSHSSVLQKAIGTVREWRNALEDSVSQRISDRTSRHGSEPAINHSHHTSYSFDYGTPKFQTTAPFECHHHLVRDLEDSASETALLCDVDVQPIAPGLQSEGSIRSMTSSKASTTVGSLPGDHDFSEGMQTPISTYSDAFEHDDATSERSGHFAGDHRGSHLVRHIGDHLVDKVHSTLNVGGHVKSGDETMTITKTMMMGSEENAPRDEDYSDSETLRVQSSVDHSDSEDTIIANNDIDPVGVLRPTAELEESHLSLHVSSVPIQSVWEQKISSKAEEAESLLRDVHRTHNALQEQIDLYDADIQDIRSSRERIYDTVAADPEHIYDPVADAGLHHARGALVMSQPVQRPLAVTPPSYDATVPAIPAYSSPITDVLHYAEGELGVQQRLYQDDENIYEEIGAPQTVPPKIGQGVTHIPEPEYAVPPSIGVGITVCDKHIKEPEYAVPPAIGEGAVAAAVAEPEYAAPRIGEGAMGITEVSQLHYADTNLNDLNANIDKNHSTIESRIFRKKNDSQRKQTPYQSSDFFHAELIHIDEHGEISTGEHGGKLNRSLGRKHQIIHDIDEERHFSSEKRICPTETFENAKPILSPTFQKLQHQYTPEDVPHGKAPSPVPPPNSEYDMNKYVDVDVDAAAAAQDKLDRETVLATVEIRRMSRTNQWTEGGSRDFDHGPLSPSSPMLSPKVVISPKKTTGLRSPTAARRSASSERQEIIHSHQYNERSFGKRESQQPHRGIEKSTAIFDEYTFEGLPTTMEFPVTKGKFVRETSPTPKTRHSIGTGAVATTATSIGKGVEVEKPTPVIGTGATVGGSITVVGSGVDLLKRSPELEDIKPMAPTKPAPIGGGVTSTTTTVGATIASPTTPTFQKGFVHEMARRYEQTHGNETAKTPQRSSSPKIKLSDRQWRSQGTLIGSGVSVVAPTRGTTAKVSVQEKVRILERAATHGESQPDIVPVEESREQKRQRMVSIGTPESINLDEIDLPRRSPSRSNSRAQASAGNSDTNTIVRTSTETSSQVEYHHHHYTTTTEQPRTSSSTLLDHPPPAVATIVAPEEAEPTEQAPPLRRNGTGGQSWPVKTHEHVNISPPKFRMPDIESFVHNGNLPHPEKIVGEENAVLRDWNPRALVRALYEVSYEPRVETKRNRFVSMEGHVEVPSDETATVAELERCWKQLYMRTKEGRLQIFVSHCADEAPAEEVVLSGVDVDANREERTLTIHGGRDHIRMTLRVQSNVFDKWRHSLLSHAASSQIDAYVKPIPKTFQHLTERVVVIELGSCSIRGGVLTTEPSLPQSFFPAIAVRTDDGRIIVGEEAYAPEIRHHGEFVRPIQALDPNVERYTMDREVVKECIKKVIQDIKVKPSQYKVLLSIPQNIPVALIGELLTLILKDIGFQGAAITRQPSLILYAYDVTTGVVVDIGDRLNIVPVIDGYVVESAICSIPYGATQVREALRTTLCSNNKGLYSFQSPIEKLILRYVLEQATLHGRRTSYVPEDYTQEEKTSKEVNISLDRFDPIPGMPTKFNIDNSRFLCTEGLFRPKKWGLDTKGLHHLIHDAVQMSPIDSRRTLYRNIYLAGGASLMPGLAEKLEQELAAIVPNSIHTQVHISPWRYNAAYLGAQIVASASTFSDSCVSLENLPTFLAHLQSSCF